MAKITREQKVRLLDRIYDERMSRQERDIKKGKYSSGATSQALKYIQDTGKIHKKRDKILGR
jgi:hypothetical protein